MIISDMRNTAAIIRKENPGQMCRVAGYSVLKRRDPAIWQNISRNDVQANMAPIEQK